MNSRIKVTKHDSEASFAGLLCRHRPSAVLQGRKRTVIDESGSLAITAWACADCGQLIEEVRMLSRSGNFEERPVRYVVGPRQRMDGHRTISARH